jgi:hypothetical protein
MYIEKKRMGDFRSVSIKEKIVIVCQVIAGGKDSEHSQKTWYK